MTDFDWRLLIAMPAAILAAGAVTAALMRWQATATVFWVLTRHSSRWADAAKKVPEFEPLFRAGEMVGRLEQENKMLHDMLTKELGALPLIAKELGEFKLEVTLLKDQMGRFVAVVEDMPERMAVMEDRQRAHTEEGRRGRTK